MLCSIWVVCTKVLLFSVFSVGLNSSQNCGWDDHVGSVSMFHSSLAVILSHGGFLYSSSSLLFSLIYLSRWWFPKREISELVFS